jgi:hypothetical protein
VAVAPFTGHTCQYVGLSLTIPIRDSSEHSPPLLRLRFSTMALRTVSVLCSSSFLLFVNAE